MSINLIAFGAAARPATAQKMREHCGAIGQPAQDAVARSTLARLEAPLCLIDNVDTPLAAHDAIVAVAAAERFQRVANLHGTIPGVHGCLRTTIALVNVATWQLAHDAHVRLKMR
jgi:hypothetical protein